MTGTLSRRARAGLLLVIVGVGVFIVGLRADHVGLGGPPGVGWKQMVTAGVGASAAALGLVLARKALPRLLGASVRAIWRKDRLVPILVALTVYGGAYGLMQDRLAPTGDEPHYMLEAYSLAIDRDRNLASDYTDPVRIAPMFGSLVPSVHAFNFSGDPEVAISQHSVGLPLLLVPAAVMSDDPRLMRIEMILVAVALAYLLLSVLRRVAGGGPLVYAVWAGVAFSLPVLSYSSQVYPELPGALLLLLAVRLLLEPQPGRWSVAAASAAAGALPWLHFRFGLLSLAIVAALLVRTVAREDLRHLRLRASLPAVGPFLAGVGLLALGHLHWYGSASPTASTALQQPRPEFDLPWAYSYSLGGLLQPAYGWLPYAPLHLLAIVGLGYLCWQRRGWALFAVAVVVPYLFATGSAKPAGAGFFFPARYQMILIPLAAVPLLYLLREVRIARIIAAPLAALTAALTVVGVDRIETLIYTLGPNRPALPLAKSLAGAWPQIAPGTGGDDYPDLPLTLAYVLLTLLASALAARSVRATGNAD